MCMQPTWMTGTLWTNTTIFMVQLAWKSTSGISFFCSILQQDDFLGGGIYLNKPVCPSDCPSICLSEFDTEGVRSF